MSIYVKLRTITSKADASTQDKQQEEVATKRKRVTPSIRDIERAPYVEQEYYVSL